MLAVEAGLPHQIAAFDSSVNYHGWHSYVRGVADIAGAGHWAASGGRLHLHLAADRAHGAAVSVGLLLLPADLLHDHLPHFHRAPLQQVHSAEDGLAQVSSAHIVRGGRDRLALLRMHPSLEWFY